MESKTWAYQGIHSTLTIQQWRLCGPLHHSGIIWSPMNSVFHSSYPHHWTCYQCSHSVVDESCGFTHNTYCCHHPPMLRYLHSKSLKIWYIMDLRVTCEPPSKGQFIGVVVFSPQPQLGINLFRRKPVLYPQPPQCETSSECSLFWSRCNGRIRI